jgi:hypothetical protein
VIGKSSELSVKKGGNKNKFIKESRALVRFVQMERLVNQRKEESDSKEQSSPSSTEPWHILITLK